MGLTGGVFRSHGWFWLEWWRVAGPRHRLRCIVLFLPLDRGFVPEGGAGFRCASAEPRSGEGFGHTSRWTGETGGTESNRGAGGAATTFRGLPRPRHGAGNSRERKRRWVEAVGEALGEALEAFGRV